MAMLGEGVDLTALNALLLDIHRAGCEVPFNRFRKLILREVHSLIPFDAGWWGNGSSASPNAHNLYLHNCDTTLPTAYRPWMRRDLFRAALLEQPGVAINLADLTTRAQYVRSAVYRHFCKRFGIEWSLGVSLAEPTSSLYEFLTVWRHDPKLPFSESERLALELLMPHLAQAYRVARLRGVVGRIDKQDGCWALADERGYLSEVTPSFVHCLRKRWPAWQGRELPAELCPNEVDGRLYLDKHLRIQVSVKDGFRYLEIFPASPLDRLSPRERDIAHRYARGETYADIAGALGISPATVRNHLAHCFSKLAVRNKAQLVQSVLKHSPASA